MNICFFEQFGENYDDEQKIFETNVNTVPSRKDGIVIDDNMYTVKELVYCYDNENVEPTVEVFIRKKEVII
jgi:hypothetical protein